MAGTKRIGDLEISEDFPHTRREWAIERAAWVIMAAVIIAALAGVLGRGPLSKARAGQPGTPLWVEYERFARNETPAQLRIHVQPKADGKSRTQLSLNRDFIGSVEIERIDPGPATSELAADEISYTFDIVGSSAPLLITLSFVPHRSGRLPVSIGLDGTRVELAPFFYP